MSEKERKRRFLTIELSQDMTDVQEKRFKDSIAGAIDNLRHKDNRGLLIIPKIALRIDNDSEIVVVKNNIVLTK